MLEKKKGAVLVPVYNEENSLTSLLSSIKIPKEYQIELVFINDGSTDRSEEILRSHNQNVISHCINLGYKGAIKTGLQYSKDRQLNFCIFMDADGQHNFADVLAAIEYWGKNDSIDLLVGSRFIANKTQMNIPLSKRIGMKCFSFLTKLSGANQILDTTSGFKLFNRKAIETILPVQFADFHAEMLMYAALSGLRIEEFPINVKDRLEGESMYKWWHALIYPLTTALMFFLLFYKAGKKRRIRN